MVLICKMNLNERLSKKTSVCVIIAIALFVIIAIIASVIGGNYYYKNSKAKITNYSLSTADDFHMRSDGLSLVCKYENGTDTVDLNQIIKVSKRAHFKIVAILDANMEKTNLNSAVLSVENNEKYFVIVNVSSEGGFVKNGYLIEIVNENDYSDKSPSFEGISDFNMFEY